MGFTLEGTKSLVTLCNPLHSHWSIQVLLTLLESILIIYFFLENHPFYLDFQMYWQKVEQAFPHKDHQNESQWHNAKGNSVRAVLWGTKPKVFQAIVLS